MQWTHVSGALIGTMFAGLGNRWGLLGCFLLSAVSLPAQPAQTRRAPTLNGRVEGSLQVMSAESVTLNGGAEVTGDLLVPGTPGIRLNGQPVYAGTLDGTGSAAPTGHVITLNGKARLRHVVRRTDASALPVVAAPPTPAGTRTVSLNHANQSPGDFATLKHLTLNGGVGAVAVPPGTYGNFTANGGSGFTLGVPGAATPAVYHFQGLTLNGQSSFQVVGPVVVTLQGGLSANGDLGAATHPEWLRLRLAGGSLTLNGNVAVFATLEAPVGTLTINGNSRFVGAVSAERIVVNGNGLLRLPDPPPVPNQPPVVTLTAPAAGAAFVAPATINLAASATDADGTVARVEFFNGTAKLGEALAAPYAFAWADVPAGTFLLTARATDTAGASATSPPVSVTVAAQAVPFLAGFEPTEGYAPGPLHGQNGWAVAGAANVVAAPVKAGRQALAVPPATPPGVAARSFDNADPGVTFVDIFVRPAAATQPADGVFLETDAARVALTGVSPAGVLHGFDGDGAGGGTWVSAGQGPPLAPDGRAADWLRLTTRSDYALKRWDLYLDGRMIAADLGFVSAGQSAFTGLGLGGHPQLETGFDELLVAFDNPLFGDADLDGMDDAWETAHGLSPVRDDRAEDFDHDGLTNLQEFVLATDPANADSDADGVPDLQERALGTNPTNSDTDGDGLPDGWERAHGFDPLSATDALGDPDGDGLTNLAEFQQGKDPTDYYNGVLPQMVSLVATDGALGPGDTLSIRVTNPAGTPLENAPVGVTATRGGHFLSATPTGPMAQTVTVRTDSDGIARAYVRSTER